MADKTEKIGVVGAGTMGAGIAQVAAQAGFETLLYDIKQEFIDAGLGRIASFLKGSRERGKISAEEEQQVLDRLRSTTKLEDFAGYTLIIEAAPEILELKRDIFKQLDAICGPETLIATNTSSFSVTAIAASTQHTERILGLHFFNPPALMALVEVIQGDRTTDETVEKATALVRAIGKTPARAKDTPGFIVNRLFIPYLLSAIRLYESGAASKEDIDEGMVLGCNHPMGPLALADFVGLDTVFFVANALFDEFKEGRYAPPPLLRKMVAARYLGRKTGKGFYEYK